MIAALGVFKLYSDVKTGTVDETTITTSLSSVLGGIGLIFAKDFNVTGSAQNEKEVMNSTNPPDDKDRPIKPS